MKTLKVKFIVLALVPLFVVLCQFRGYWSGGICSRVVDGDTVIVDGRSIRMVYIDAPEKAQWDRKKARPVGQISTKYLRHYCQGKKVRVKLFGTDRYGRYLGEVYLKGESLNFQMVLAGMAFIYPYARFESVYQRNKFRVAYKLAKKSKKGIFKNSVLKPITYRKRQRSRRAAKKH